MERYDKFLSMEEVHATGETGVDRINGIEIPYEYRMIGMVRNAKNGKKLKVYLKPAPHVILSQDVPLRGWYKNKYEPPKVRARPCFTEALLTQPYGGACPVRCHFCYVNNGIRGYRGQGVSTVDPEYPAKIGRQLDKMLFGWNAYISSFTEPFQALEGLYHNTERLSEEVTSRGLPLFYLTRQIPPDWAAKNLLKSKYSYQQFSIITSDRDTYRKLSPGAAPLDAILRFIREVLRPQGIYVSIQVNPILLGIVDEDDICKLIRELGKAGANHVIFKFVEIVAPAAKFMVERMSKLFPGDRARNFATLFSENTGGLKTILQQYRLIALERFRTEVKQVGMTMALCYEYSHKTNQSIGREWCTADQCHGMHIPIHMRQANGKFEPYEGCPPSGCLYCKETAGEPAPCGVPFLQRATALLPKDYQKDWWEEVR